VSPAAQAQQAPQPDEIYERTRDEGRRRLSRPILELAATALVGGFDVAGLSVAGNLVGGLLFVTHTRFGQAIAAEGRPSA
jgi:hypothetical protein